MSRGRARTGALLLALVLSTAAAQEDRYEPFRAVAGTRIPELLSLAEWCAENRLRWERARALEAVLGFDPEHREARRALGYVRDRDGSWRRSTGYRSPRSRPGKLRPEFEARRRKILKPFLDDVLAELDSRGTELTGPERDRLFAGLLALLPEDPALRAARGETKHEGEWLLRETVNALPRAPALGRRAREILAGMEEPGAAEITAEERGYGVRFAAARHTDEALRVVTTLPEAEARQAARLSGAARRVLDEALGLRTRFASRFTIYLLGGPREKDALLANHPDATDETRRFLSNLLTGWLPRGNTVLIWPPEESLRHEWVCRQTTNMLLKGRFGITIRNGALAEGLGLYLGHLVSGGRATWFVRQTEYGRGDPDFDAKMREPGADWLRLAQSLVKGGEGPDYHFLLGADVNAMNAKDLIHSYVLGAYLIEGEPAGRTAYLAAIGKGEHPDEAVPAAFGRSVAEFQRRVHRWLDERLTR